jgi:MinD-like ATPase involved in chromosome partitioning or flagellar assembly
MDLCFDNSLPRLVDTIVAHLGESALEQGVVLRDASGRLSFVAGTPANSQVDRAQIEKGLSAALGPYARTDRLVFFSDDAGATRLLADPARLPIQVGGRFCKVLDRRIVGAGWLQPPEGEAKGPPRIVFASLKGGVGRSTALAVAAADLAQRNKNVLVVDLDLEAPGLGNLLLDDERMPRLGTVDFLVENGIGGIPDSLLPSFLGVSALTTGSGGRVDIMPALGQLSAENPENVLPKLARAMIEDIADNGAAIPLTAQIATMIDRLTARGSYDIVLIDSRAGLAELAAPAVLGLGATILLFGTAQKQTIDGYRALFAGLKLLAQRDRAAERKADWRLLLKAVYAKASLDETTAARYRDDLYDLFAEHLYDAEEQADLGEDAINFAIDDPSAPHWPLVVSFNSNFVDFDPIRAPGQLTHAFYEQAFRPFLTGIDAIAGFVAVNRGESGATA